MKYAFFILFAILMACPVIGLASSVTKTVGVGQDYTTIGDALTAVNSLGLADTVSLALMDTIYTESPLMYNPTMAQPTALYMFQAGSAKPHVQINAGGLPFGMLINNRAEFVMYNVKVEPSTSTPWMAGVSVRSMDQGSKVYIQSGGVTGSTTQRGYEVIADSSSDVHVFGCLVINVQTVGIYIELQDFPPFAGTNTHYNRLSTGVGSIRIDSNTIEGSTEIGIKFDAIGTILNDDYVSISSNAITKTDTGIVVDGLSVLTLDINNNAFYEINQAIGFYNTVADTVNINDNAAPSIYNKKVPPNTTMVFHVHVLELQKNLTGKRQLNILRNTLSVGSEDGASIDINTNAYNVTISDNTLSSSSISPWGVRISALQGSNPKLTMNNNVISGCNIGTQIDSLSDYAEIYISGGADTVANSSVYLPNGHNVSVFNVGSSALTSNSMLARRASASMLKLASMQTSGSTFSPTSSQICYDLTINNDPGITCEVTIAHTDMDWTKQGISILGDFAGTATIQDVNIELNNNLLDPDEIGVKIANIKSSNTGTFNTEMLQLNLTGNKGIVLDSLNGGTHEIAGCNITAGTTGVEANEAYVSTRRLFIFMHSSIDVLTALRTRYRVVSLEKLASAKSFSSNNYTTSTAINLNLHSDSCEVRIEDGDIDWIGNGIVLDASPSTKYNFKNLDINLNNSGGYTAMQYRAKRAEVPTNINVANTAELNTVHNAGTAFSFDLQPIDGTGLTPISLTGNNVYDCGKGIEVEFDNDTTGGFIMADLIFPGLTLTNSMFENMIDAGVPNFVCMQLKSKRSELPTNIDAIKLSNNSINGGSHGGLAPFDIDPSIQMESMETDSNNVSNFAVLNVPRTSLAARIKSMRVTHNTFDNVIGAEWNLESELVQIENNTFTCSNSGLPVSSMPGRKYELQVRASSRAQLTSTSFRPDFSILLGGNSFCDGDLDVTIINDDTTSLGMNASIVNNQTNGNVSINTYDTETDITGNTFGSSAGMSNSAMATNRYELQFRRSSRFNLANLQQQNSVVSAGLNFTKNTLNGFADVSLSIDDTAGTVSISLDSNVVTAGTGLENPSMRGAKYELSVRRSGRAQIVTSSSSSVTGSDLTYTNNSVTGYPNTVFDVEDSTGTTIASFTGNTFTGVASTTGSNSSEVLANRYEVSVTRGSRTRLQTSASNLLTSTDWFTYNNNTVTGYPGGLFDLTNGGDAGTARFEGNTFTETVVQSNSIKKQDASMPANKYEVNYRRGSKVGFATSLGKQYNALTNADSLIVQGNTFHGLDGGGFFLNTENNAAGDTLNVWLDGNTLSSVSAPFRLNLYESESDSGYTKFLETANIVNGGLQASNVMDGRYNLLLGNLMTASANRMPHISTSPNTFSNGGGLQFTGSPIDTIQLNFQNIFGNTMNVVNATNNVVDARYCWWGTTDSAEIASKMQGNVLFMPFLTDSVTSTIGSIVGRVYIDADASYSYNSGELLLQGQVVSLWQNNTLVNADTTDISGTYNFSNLPVGIYSLRLTPVNGYVGTENANGATVAFISGNVVTENFGIYQELMRFRTFKADTSLSKKPVKIAFKNKVLTSAYPNTATSLENVFARLGKSGATFLGVSQSNKNRAKVYSWLAYAKAADLGKLYISAHTGSPYPIDSLRPAGKKAKALKGALKADRKTYNNTAWEQGVAFNLNLIASALGVTPQGFGELVVDSSFMLAGRNLEGMTLSEVGDWMNQVMTYWDSLGVDNSTAYAELGSFTTNFLKRVNDGFSAAVTTGNSTIDTTAVTTGDIYILGTKKNPYALTLKGVATASSVGLVKYVPSIAPKVVIQDVGYSDEAEVPTSFGLQQNYPNPFNPSTVINYSLPNNGLVTLKIYDLLGREVATLIQNETMEAGNHEINFNATSLTSGVYFYRINVESVDENGINKSFTDVKRMLLLK